METYLKAINNKILKIKGAGRLAPFWILNIKSLNIDVYGINI
ncbi:hypothetical protein psyc5s11_43630 [Clostridium gelidum]|uniref:Uncharacterized protein n=1 Tax=Clostridium gelidum TaxID=704125 RepID=A0ABM7T8K4_9CLOT|nr:hypothetical protein psyc5s11_43630 [Clostridium gelidum]